MVFGVGRSHTQELQGLTKEEGHSRDHEQAFTLLCPPLICPWVPRTAAPPHLDFYPHGKVAPWESHWEPGKAFLGSSSKQAVLGTQMSVHGHGGQVQMQLRRSTDENHRRQARMGLLQNKCTRGYWAEEIVAPEVWKEPQRLARLSCSQCRDLSSGTPTYTHCHIWQLALTEQSSLLENSSLCCIQNCFPVLPWHMPWYSQKSIPLSAIMISEVRSSAPSCGVSPPG